MTSKIDFSKRNWGVRLPNLLGAAVVLLTLNCAWNGAFVWAQSGTALRGTSKIGGSSYLHRPSLPTGELAAFQRIGNPKAGQIQPVEWKLPEGVVVGVAAEGGYVQNEVFGLALGSVYRFQIKNVPFNSGRTLYPTLEIIGTLNPPAGRKWDFPIEIVIPQEDLELALKANLVTRVVFVENSENAADVDSSEPGKKITIDISTAVDPVAVAETRGRAVAILRMGSREPNGLPSAQNPFYFGLPPFELKPNVVSDVAPAVQTTSEGPQALEMIAKPQTINSVDPKSSSDEESVPRSAE